MGNGSSIFLSAELSKKLSEKSVRTFQDFENECIARNLNGEEIYDLLVSKYDELLDFTHHLPQANEVDVHEEEKPSTAMRKVQKAAKQVPKSSWGASRSAKSKHLKKSEIYAKYSKIPPRKSLHPPSSAASESESSKTLQETVDSSERCTHCENAIYLERTDSMESIDADDESVGIGFDGTITVDNGNKDWEFECKLCQKHFATRARLDVHLKFSEVHRFTLVSLKEKFFSDANGLDSLAKKAINYFQESAQATHSFMDGTMNLQKMRWKKAIGKVVSQFIARKYESMVNQLQNSSSVANLQPDGAGKVSLIHSDCKFFWRIKSRFMFHFYYHESHDCIEIIPQLLPSMLLTTEEKQEKDRISHSAQASNNGFTMITSGLDHELQPTTDVYKIQKEFLNNPTHRETFEKIPVSPRFYVSCFMIQMILGNDYHTGKTFSEMNEKNNAQNTNQGIKKNPMFTHSNVSDLEMCKFLISKLKIDYHSIANGVAIEKAVYFEDQHVLKNSQPIPINTMMPVGLTPVDMETTKLYEQWEIKTKLREITLSHQQLNEAVSKAEEVSKKVLLLSPRFLNILSPLLSPTKRMANKMVKSATISTYGPNSRIPIDSIYFPTVNV
jgi:hypothetical protein